VTPVRFDQQGIAAAEGARELLILELEPGAALQEGHPFMLVLVVPMALWSGGAAGMDALNPQSWLLQQHGGGFFPGRRARPRQQIGAAAFGGGILLSPAPADLKAAGAGQAHHVVVVAAVAQGIPHRRVGVGERHKGIERGHLLEELLQLRFSHGRCW